MGFDLPDFIWAEHGNSNRSGMLEMEAVEQEVLETTPTLHLGKGSQERGLDVPQRMVEDEFLRSTEPELER